MKNRAEWFCLREGGPEGLFGITSSWIPGITKEVMRETSTTKLPPHPEVCVF